jgi:hypothetical protein
MATLPALAVPAPSNPPIKACELLDGMPTHQVITFHDIAPISAEKITGGLTTAGSMMPVPIVWATCSPKKRNAMKLKKAAQNTAALGGKEMDDLELQRLTEQLWRWHDEALRELLRRGHVVPQQKK